MSTDPKPAEERGNIILGFVILAIAAIGLFFAVRAVYRWMYPPEPQATIALSAWFETVDHVPVLRIEGQVQRSGMLLDKGEVSVVVNKLVGDFRQSFLVHLKAEGKFDVTNSPALRNLSQGDRLYIEAEAWSDGKYLGEAVVYLYASKPPIPRADLLWGSVTISGLLVLGFLWAFTGTETMLKNRVSIACTYLVILVFLTAPLGLPLLMDQCYPEFKKMMQEAPVGFVQALTQAEKNNPKAETQWYLNIGGVVGTDETLPAGRQTILTGGLAIPFFILVLSCIGGAINLTRKVPAFHDDSLRVDTLSRLVSRGMSGIRTLVGQPPALKPGGGGSSPPVRTPFSGSPAESWRIGLVKQYMYLISAPFLGIATYYLLLWLDLTPKPVVVLVSFSVGLISDQIVERLIKVVQGFLGREHPGGGGRPPKPGPITIDTV